MNQFNYDESVKILKDAEKIQTIYCGGYPSIFKVLFAMCFNELPECLKYTDRVTWMVGDASDDEKTEYTIYHLDNDDERFVITLTGVRVSEFMKSTDISYVLDTANL